MKQLDLFRGGLTAGVLVLLAGILLAISANAAYLRNVPQTVVQPDGDIIECFATGDEFYNWLHDANGYVIIQDPVTGYYVYAVELDGDLVASPYIVNRVDPASVGIEPNLRISPEKLRQKLAAMRARLAAVRPAAPHSGTINNLVIFVRFAGEPEFTDQLSAYGALFNDGTPGANSMRNYFLEASYGALTIASYFYPIPPGATVVSYQDGQARGYYQPYNAVTNPGGYTGGDDGPERQNRERSLIVNAIAAVAGQVPGALNIDGDGDNIVDSFVFVISGSPTGWGSILWPHRSVWSGDITILNGRGVRVYDVQLRDTTLPDNVGVLCHEMFHTLGAPDLYHYVSNGISPAGPWDIMDNDQNPPQHMCAYMKWRYGLWISSIPTISAPGTYTLNPLTSPTGQCFAIQSPHTPFEFFVVEYRRKTGTFEGSLPKSGLLVWRIDTTAGNGNADGPPDEVYVYRPGGTTTQQGNLSDAPFSIDYNRDFIDDTTDPSSFLSDGDPGGLRLCAVGPIGDTITFKLQETVGDLKICKYNDKNLNGVFDSGEALANWPFRVTNTSGYSQNVVTASNGCVTIPNLRCGDYTVTELVPTPDANGNFTFQGKRWHAFSPLVQTVHIICGQVNEVTYRNVCLAAVNVCKFEDKNMNGLQDAGEPGLSGWPINLKGTRANGTPVSLSGTTGANGCYSFEDLYPGSYATNEDGEMAWTTVQTVCGSTMYCDYRTTWQGKRWQCTRPVPPSVCPPGAHAPSIGPFPVVCEDVLVRFGNVCLSKITAFKFHDVNMKGTYAPAGEPFTDSNGNGVWDAAEPFTDVNCNGKWDYGEFYLDVNNNGKWDAAEAFTDQDGDKNYDWPECPIPTWPFTLTGNRADGKPVCLSKQTDAAGLAVFEDVAPSDGSGYTLAEDVAWCLVNLPTGPVYRATYPVAGICAGPQVCDIVRWQATTPIQQTFVPPYCEPVQKDFGNVCLSRVDGVKEVYDDGMPGQAPPKPGVGWKIDLAGVDHLGKAVVPSYPECVLLPAAAKAPIAIPCLNPAWYETVTDASGKFAFVDLLPGHYHMAEQPNANYRLMLSKPVLSGFDVLCCPQEVVFQNIRKDVATNVYQAYPASSFGVNAPSAGYLAPGGDNVTSIGGVLKIVPGTGWANFLQATELCRESVVKNAVLTKETPETIECPQFFSHNLITQRGTPKIRLRWPLLFEAPGTTWTLSITYRTLTPVQFPGESKADYVHTDVWKWVVDVTPGSIKDELQAFHELPFGRSQVPLVADDGMYAELQHQLDLVDAAVKSGDVFEAADLLDEFETMLIESCVSSEPLLPDPVGPGIGIAETWCYPACCKLILDAEYMYYKLGLR